MAGQVEGKIALVTGGASGIGEAVVELFAREGATVVITDIDELRGPELARRITKAGGKAIFLEQDVTSEERWIEIVAEIAKRYGRLDIHGLQCGHRHCRALDRRHDARAIGASRTRSTSTACSSR